jgi:hypothetical protein
VAELCRRIFPTVRPMDLFLAYSEVLGFLMYLEDLGRAERVPGRPTTAGRGQVYHLHSTESVECRW